MQTYKILHRLAIMLCVQCLLFSLTAHGANRFSRLLETLQSHDGLRYREDSSNTSKLQVICFLGCECPLAKLYAGRLEELWQEYRKHGVVFIGVNSNPQDSLADLAHYVDETKITFPILKDPDQTVATALDAKRTPEVIVLDSKGIEIYRGRIDDQYQPGLARTQPSREDLKQAIQDYLSEKPITTPRTEAVGCLIARRREAKTHSTVTFTNQVSRVLLRNCVECHRQGEIGPFALVDYDEVVGWADMILETIEQHRMPPWHANPKHGNFANARFMSEDDRQSIRQWVEDGTPFGNAAELPTTEAHTSKLSSLPRFDMELAMQTEPYQIASEGTIEYQYFVVDPKFEEDRWVRSAELIPSNRSVVHHGIAFVRPPDGVMLNGIGWLTAYVPGQTILPPPATLARRIPAGSKIVFQMHYTPNGKPQEDLSRLRLTFADESEVTDELVSIMSLNQELEIPPGESHVPIEGFAPPFPSNGKLLAMSPHMHLRGKSIQVESIVGDKNKIMLDVPHYDFNWQHTYILRDPIPVSSLGKLKFTAIFDNSAKNPFNPDPTTFVTWGDQTWEEMAIVFYDLAVPRVGKPKDKSQSLSVAVGRAPDDTQAASRNNPSTEVSDQVRATAKQLFQDLDRNGDEKIEYDEVDQVVQLRSFHWYDLNRDRVIHFDEATNAIVRMNR